MIIKLTSEWAGGLPGENVKVADGQGLLLVLKQQKHLFAYGILTIFNADVLFQKSIVHFQNYPMLLTYMEHKLKCSWLFRDLNLGHWL